MFATSTLGVRQGLGRCLPAQIALGPAPSPVRVFSLDHGFCPLAVVVVAEKLSDYALDAVNWIRVEGCDRGGCFAFVFVGNCGITLHKSLASCRQNTGSLDLALG